MTNSAIISDLMSEAADKMAEYQDTIARLKAVNEELVKALEQCVGVCAGDIMHKSGLVNALELARAALAKAKEVK